MTDANDLDRGRGVNKESDGHVKRRRINYFGVIPYFGLVLVMLLCFYLNDQNQKEDEKKRCVAGEDSRAAQRAIVDAVFQLAGGVAVRDPDAPPLTAQEILQYNAYIDQVNSFRNDTYDLIKPSELCLPYVDDGNVKPSTPDLAHIPKNQEGG